MNRRAFLALPTVALPTVAVAAMPSAKTAPAQTDNDQQQQKRRRRLKKLLISKELLPSLIRGGAEMMLFPSEGVLKLRVITCLDLPLDLEVVHVEWDFAYDQVSIICRSETFEEIDAGEGTIPSLPPFNPRFYQEYLDATEIAERMETVRQGLLGPKT